MELDPIAVALKFGFLAVLYLFLLWVARSALKDLRHGARTPMRVRVRTSRTPRACTRASAPLGRDGGAPKLRVKTGGGPFARLRL